MVIANSRIIADRLTADVFSQPDVLAEASLEPPQITQLAQLSQSLGFQAGTLTVEEMWQQFKQLVA